MDLDLGEIQQQLERAVSGDQRAMSDLWERHHEAIRDILFQAKRTHSHLVFRDYH
jgi:hypothetical protein